MEAEKTPQQYQCTQCKETYDHVADCTVDDDIKCPKCGSEDIEIPEHLKEFLSFMDEVSKSRG